MILLFTCRKKKKKKNKKQKTQNVNSAFSWNQTGTICLNGCTKHPLSILAFDFFFFFFFVWFATKAAFGSCKSISGKYSIFRKICYFPKRKMFSYVWLHFKKCFGKKFLIFGCVLENTIENTFSTYCSHFLSYQTII